MHGSGAALAVVADRLVRIAERWRVEIEHTRQTPSSIIGFGRHAGQKVVLKVAKAAGDEWNAGAVAAAFAGSGVVRVLAHAPGVVLLERLTPGTPLVEMSLTGEDGQAVSILAQVIRSMQSVAPSTAGMVSASTWGRGFHNYLASGDRRLDDALVRDARDRYDRLCRTQRRPRLLHGDLQHYNVLLDEKRGWTAIDPKGVVGETEYELGATLRNPQGMPELYEQPAAVLARIEGFARVLEIDPARTIEWAYTQAVLSAIWIIEDGGDLDTDQPSLLLAAAARRLLR